MKRQNSTTMVVRGCDYGTLIRLFLLLRFQSLVHPSIYPRSLYITDCQTKNLAHYLFFFFPNKVLLVHSHAHVFTCCFGCSGATVAGLKGCHTIQPIKPKIFTTWPFTENLPPPTLHLSSKSPPSPPPAVFFFFFYY